MAKLHAAWKPAEVHHIFGRVGRLVACRYFCVPIKKKKGAANHHDGHAELLQKLKNAYWENKKAMKEKESLETQMDGWKTLIQQNAPLFERLEHSRLLEYVKEAQEIVGKRSC